MRNTTTDLISLSQDTINGEVIQTVDGRKLHSFLEVGKDYTNWAKAQIKRANLVENEDFVKLAQKGELSKTGQWTTEYHFTLEAGKHIAMMSGAAKGKEVRDYFIQCEKRANQPMPQVADAKTAALIEVLVKQDALEQAQLRQTQELASLKHEVALVKAATQPENDFFTVAGYARLHDIVVDLNTASGLGKRCSTLSKKKGLPMGSTNDPRWGRVNTYHESILSEIIGH